jgi:RimJ/RimL family protein N-acetyltransferase
MHTHYSFEPYSFAPLQKNQLDLICDWMNQVHVQQWWHDHLTPNQIRQKYGARIGSKDICPYIVYCNDLPIGFIQYYIACKTPEWPTEPESTVGLDQFIAHEDLLNKGHGTAFIQAFIKYLFDQPWIKRVITEADPKNMRAIRCYKRCGFKRVGKINTADGAAILFEINRST